MKIEYITIANFRGIAQAEIFFNGHTVLIGDNNAGKSTVFEAIDLVLGPDRLNRLPIVDEHDFFNGKYYVESGESPKIEIELVVTDLGQEQENRFKSHIEFWDTKEGKILEPGSIDTVDQSNIVSALRTKFVGYYNIEDDDFSGDTFFCWPVNEDDTLARFSKSDKRECGFLYLRALRTGSRALSMERGSLLDIILRIKEIRPKMWENVLSQLRDTKVAEDPKLGIKGVLEGVQNALKEFVPSDWGSEPILRVSDLTREHLRKTLTVFMSTGAESYHAPFQHQGTGTINTMVLALLSMIAELKKNVIFAMEEPEIAIPPYTQKRIVDSIKKKSSQAIFTSHSPFVLEEFSPKQIVLVRRSDDGVMVSQFVKFPRNIRPKNYRSEFRLRFAESLLAKRVLLTEGTTETTGYGAAARRLNELKGDKYSSLEAMGIAVFDAGSDSAIAGYGEYFRSLGKKVFAVFDKQEPGNLVKINAAVDHPFESNYKGFERLVLDETDDDILKAYYWNVIKNDEWPHDLSKYKHEIGEAIEMDEIKKALFELLKKNKGEYAVSDILGSCESAKQMPNSIRKVLREIKGILSTPVEPDPENQ